MGFNLNKRNHQQKPTPMSSSRTIRPRSHHHHHQSNAELYSKIDRSKLTNDSSGGKNDLNTSIYEVKLSPPSLTAYEGIGEESAHLITNGAASTTNSLNQAMSNYDNSEYLVPNGKRLVSTSNYESNYDNPHESSLMQTGDGFPIYENYKTGKNEAKYKVN